jgi:predicted ribosome quality control (RQC) complex YloA/Tae2 family protein
VAYEGVGDDRRAVAYAAYDLTLYADREALPRISEAIQQVAQATASFDAYAEARRRLLSRVDEQAERQRARLYSLRASLASQAEIEDLQARGNAILAMAWSIEPGQATLAVDAEVYGLAQATGGGGGHVQINLDTALTPSENAQALFQEARRLQAAGERVPALIDEGEGELAYLDQLRADISLAENRSVDGSLILVGRNSRQNDEVTFRMGDAHDIWLHAHGVPGAHVIIKRAGRDPSPGTLQQAARLAARYSAAREQARVQVDYAERRHVRHIKGGRPGMVTYSHERTLVVRPENEEEASWE